MSTMSPRTGTGTGTIHYPYDYGFRYDDFVPYDYAAVLGEADARVRQGSAMDQRDRVAAVAAGNVLPRERSAASSNPRARVGTTMEGR